MWARLESSVIGWRPSELLCLDRQVFLPLLVEHFSEVELKQLTQFVIDLHHLDSQEEKDEDTKEGGLQR